MYRPVIVTPPVIKPVTLTEVKAALDIGYTAKDDLISGLIDAATAHLDGWTGILGRCLCEQIWRQDFDDFRSCMRLPLFPVTSIVSVKYIDTSGAQQTIDDGSYSLREDALGALVRFATSYSFPPLNTEGPAVSVEYVAGYLDTPAVDEIEADPEADPPVEGVAAVPRLSNVPAGIKQAMMLMIRQWFDNPSAAIVGTVVSPMPFAVDALLAPYRRVRF